jgi:hypothetical protein
MPLLMILQQYHIGGIGGTTTSVLNNDTLNGVVLNPADVNLTLSGTAPTGFVLIVMVQLRFLLDRFQVPIWFYQICEKINPSNCDIANAKILVMILMLLMIASQHKFQVLQWLQQLEVLANNGNGADSLNGIAVTSAIPMLHNHRPIEY